MSNRFFTILLIPEKTSRVRRFVIPNWLFKGIIVSAFFAVALGGIMFLDYWYVMGQIDENKELKLENRRLRQQVQIFRNRMSTIESTLDRVQTFATRLKVITNIEDRGTLIQSFNDKLPDAATNLGKSGNGIDPKTEGAENSNDLNPDNVILRSDYWELEDRFTHVNASSLTVEENLQDLYELLVDQKSFLAALPTRQPSFGYFTSGFGVRKSPYGGREKMHEGLDIANHSGTPILAPANGLVVFAGQKPGYGRTVILDHGYGLETWYGHTSKIIVKTNQKIRRGELIALIGSTGRSTGSHVHYEVRVNGIPVDPLSYILEN